MQTLRNHWYDFGGILAAAACIQLYINFNEFTYYKIVVYISLISLFLHQLEKYRIIGTFPEMVNKVLFKSDLPDRYPLNTQTVLIINIGIGWIPYIGAAIFAESVLWLGIATIVVSIGHFVAHTFFFNKRGGTIFNAGMITSILQFLPISAVFFWIIIDQNIASLTDYLIGIPLGLLLSYLGLYKITDWLKDKDTDYVFPPRNIQ